MSQHLPTNPNQHKTHISLYFWQMIFGIFLSVCLLLVAYFRIPHLSAWFYRHFVQQESLFAHVSLLCVAAYNVYILYLIIIKISVKISTKKSIRCLSKFSSNMPIHSKSHLFFLWVLPSIFLLAAIYFLDFLPKIIFASLWIAWFFLHVLWHGRLALYTLPAQNDEEATSARILDPWWAAFVLCLLCLPDVNDWDTWLGWPARLWSTHIASSLLHMAHIPHASIEALLVLDNHVTDIEISCSGLRSLWTLLLLSCGIALLYRISLQWRFLCMMLLGLMMMIVGNGVRIGILAWLGNINLMPLANAIHQPIGILVWIAAAFPTMFYGYRYGSQHISVQQLSHNSTTRYNFFSYRIQQFLFFSSFVVYLPLFFWFSLLQNEQKREPAASTDISIDSRISDAAFVSDKLPTEIPTESMDAPIHIDWQEAALTTSELGLFSIHTTAQKWTFVAQMPQNRTLRGSVLFVRTQDWRRLHPPERCLAASGFHIDAIRDLKIRDMPVRLLNLGDQTTFSVSSVGHQGQSWSSIGLAVFGSVESFWHPSSFLWESDAELKPIHPQINDDGSWTLLTFVFHDPQKYYYTHVDELSHILVAFTSSIKNTQ